MHDEAAKEKDLSRPETSGQVAPQNPEARLFREHVAMKWTMNSANASLQLSYTKGVTIDSQACCRDEQISPLGVRNGAQILRQCKMQNELLRRHDGYKKTKASADRFESWRRRDRGEKCRERRARKNE
ncbi:unnamed protein product [Larinioides sclopetarius]|uniref:Uncharacterized protein n=1 Tax=Larinioides sclopetarius TaxID=280406 RepID=A0AAV1ZKZ6_9ARAC